MSGRERHLDRIEELFQETRLPEAARMLAELPATPIITPREEALRLRCALFAGDQQEAEKLLSRQSKNLPAIENQTCKAHLLYLQGNVETAVTLLHKRVQQSRLEKRILTALHMQLAFLYTANAAHALSDSHYAAAFHLAQVRNKKDLKSDVCRNWQRTRQMFGGMYVSTHLKAGIDKTTDLPHTATTDANAQQPHVLEEAEELISRSALAFLQFDLEVACSMVKLLQEGGWTDVLAGARAVKCLLDIAKGTSAAGALPNIVPPGTAALFKLHAACARQMYLIDTDTGGELKNGIRMLHAVEKHRRGGLIIDDTRVREELYRSGTRVIRLAVEAGDHSTAFRAAQLLFSRDYLKQSERFMGRLFRHLTESRQLHRAMLELRAALSDYSAEKTRPLTARQVGKILSSLSKQNK